MVDWIKNYWWLIWGVGGSLAYVVYSPRQTPEDQPGTGKHRSMVTRLVDPDGKYAKSMTLRILLMSAGLLVVAVFAGLVKLFE
jgi:hypothetical protein